MAARLFTAINRFSTNYSNEQIFFLSVGGALGFLAYVYLRPQPVADVVDATDANGDPIDAPTEPEPTIFDEAISQVKNFTTTIDESLLQLPNVAAFLILIRTGEGTLGVNGYRTMFGGGLFNSFDDHPRQVITRGAYTSTAAGAYQFLSRTWDGLVKQYGFRNFLPKTQDVAALALIKGRGALNDVIEGRFKVAIQKCNKEWASLPDSPYGQPTITYARAKQILDAQGVNTEGQFV